MKIGPQSTWRSGWLPWTVYQFLPFAWDPRTGNSNTDSAIDVPRTSDILLWKALRRRTSGATKHHTKRNSSRQSKGPSGHAIP